MNKTVFDNHESNNHESKNLENHNLEHGEFSEIAQRLIRQYQEALAEQELKGEVALIHVDEIASKVAFFYEKIREVVDWKETHLVRRGAIERILKRRLISEISGFRLIANLNSEKMAEPLILELIRGGHFPNDTISRDKIKEVQKILKKYIYILRANPLVNTRDSLKIKKKINFYNWILEIAACEIEETLGPAFREKALIDCMAGIMEERIRVQPESVISEAEKKKQIYIAVQRALFSLDAPIISFWLLKHRYPWWTNPDETSIQEVAAKIFSIISQLERDLNHSLKEGFSRICEKYDTVYLLLGDVLNKLEQAPQEIPRKIAQPKILEKLVRASYNKRLFTLRSRLLRMAVFSTLSIFIGSGFSLFIIEVPLAKLIYGQFSFFAVFVDIMLPTILMFLLVALVRPPGKTNLERVIKEIKKVVYSRKEKDIYEIRADKKRNPLLAFIIGVLYLLITFTSLGLVFLLFKWSRIPATSVYIDTLNIAVIVFAALGIRQKAKELVVVERTTFGEFLLDMLSVPVAKIGQWLANKWKEYNIVSVFFTVLIDAPFSALIGFIEDWSLFIKEKKAGLR